MVWDHWFYNYDCWENLKDWFMQQLRYGLQFAQLHH